MERSTYGLAFKGAVKRRIGEELFQLAHLNSFQQYLQFLEIFQRLSELSAFDLLHKKPCRNKYSERDQGCLRTIYAFVDKHYHQK